MNCNTTHYRANSSSVPGDPNESDNVTIPGSLTNLTIDNGVSGPNFPAVVDGRAAGSVFTIDAGASVTLNDLTIQNGASAGGAGINNAGTLTLNGDHVENNHASSSSLGTFPQDYGGGIANSGTLTVTTTTIAGNSVGISPNGSGGGLGNEGTANLTADTISGNSAAGLGGGVFNLAGTTQMTNVTVTGNRAPTNGGGGGVATQGGSVTLVGDTVSGNMAGNAGSEIAHAFGGTISVKSTIVGPSTSGLVCALNAGPITDSGNNFSSDTSCGFTSSNSQQGVNPELAPLGNYGGLTETMPPLRISPAVTGGNVGPDFANCPATATDQRGSVRMGSLFCNVGAVETSPYESDQSFAAQTGVKKAFPTGTLTVSAFDEGDENTGVSVTSELLSSPSHGKAVVNGDGSFSYKSSAGYAGPDSFTFTLIDSDGFVSAPITADIAVGFYIPAAAQQQVMSRGWSVKATLPIAGGVAPYTWKVASGNLPAGLTLSPTKGVISGKATGLGKTSVVIQATDSTSPTHLVAKATVTFDVLPNLYVSGVDNNSVFEWSPASGAQRTIASGLNGPNGVAVDADGNLYVSEIVTGLVEKITPSGAMSTYITGLSSPSRVATDSSGDVFVADTGNNRVRERTTTGTIKTVVKGLNGPIGVACDGLGDLYVTQTGNNILVVTPSGTQSSMPAAFDIANGIGSDASGFLDIADYGANAIEGADPFTDGDYTVPVTGLNHPNDVAVSRIAGVTTLYVADHDNNNVIRYSNGSQSVVPLTGVSGPNSVAVG